MRRVATSVAIAIFAACSAASAANPRVVFETNQGNFEVELFADKAPLTVKNILEYVDAGFYDGLVFHRVIKGFMLQGGGFTADLKQKQPRAPVKNEANNGLKNVRGTLAMARTADPDSATSQFFVNTIDNTFLDHTSMDPRGMGYTVFGKVVSGMEVIDKIENVRTMCPSKGAVGPCTDPLPPGMRDVPAAPGVVITKAYKKKA
jgi:cyclophilin family peptidyl-prolyl cis-trans isomerase